MFVRLIIAFFLFFLPFSSIAQPLSNYVNMQNQVMVWDKGLLRKIDYLPPILMKTGRTAIPYIDNARSFKVYYGGGMKTINIGFTTDFNVSDNLVAYKNNTALNVFDNGKPNSFLPIAKNIGWAIVCYCFLMACAMSIRLTTVERCIL